MLMNNLSILVRYSRIFSEHKLQDFGIGFPEQLILMYLSANQKVNQEKIASHFMLDKGTIAKTLSKLEEKGLILRIENPDNKREKLIELTSEGSKILCYMESALKEWNSCIYDGLGESEIEQINRLTGIMAANVAKLAGKDWCN